VPRQDSFAGAELEFLRSLGRSSVFADGAADGLSALDPGSDVDGLAGFALQGPLMPRLVRPVAIAVLRVLGQGLPEVLLPDKRLVVQALAAQCSCESFRETARPPRPDGSLDDPRAIPGECLAGYRGSLLSRSRNTNL
jgi:hypothetical protein